MLNWITDYISYVETHPANFNRDVKNNIRQIKELIKRKNIYYKEADPNAFVKFCKMFKHREGILAGTPLILNMEQKYIVACIFGIKEWCKEENRYLRYFTELDLFVARKWGKDHFIAPMIAWFIGLDKEPNAWGQIVAENSQQSGRTFEIVEKEIKKAPLNKFFFKTGSKEKRVIRCKINDGKLEYLSGRERGKEGSNPSLAVANEVHEITRFKQYNSLKTGQGARSQPMMIVISSAGTTPDSLYETLLERNRKFLSKSKLGKRDRIFALMYGIDETDKVEDSSCWVKANPAMYEGRPTMKFLKEQYESMKDDPIMLSDFIAKQLNRQIGASIEYFDMPAIKKSRTTIKAEDFINTYAVGGVDLAETTDLCNATACILKKDGMFLYLQAYFIAEEVLERNSKKDKQNYDAFTKCNSDNEIVKNLVIITPGSYVQKEYVTQWFCKLRDEYKISFLKIGYDRALSKEWLTDMQENGFSHEIAKIDKESQTCERDYGILTQVAQGGWSLSEPIKIIKSLFDNGRIGYDRTNVLLPYCFANLKVKVDSNNNMSPHKSKSTGHIDGTIGIFNSFVAYQRAKELDDYKNCISEYFGI